MKYVLVFMMMLGVIEGSMKQMIVEVEGMKCAFCGKRLEKWFLNSGEVASVEIWPEDGELGVVFLEGGKVEYGAIEEMVKKSGLSLREMRVLIEGRVEGEGGKWEMVVGKDRYELGIGKGFQEAMTSASGAERVLMEGIWRRGEEGEYVEVVSIEKVASEGVAKVSEKDGGGVVEVREMS